MTTIKDIAKEAGVAPSVVSRALNNKYGVKDSTKELIQKIAQRMEYHPNAVARSLVTRKTDTIGIMMADLSEPFYSQIIKGMEYVANREGFTLLFSNSYESVEQKRLMYKMVLAGRVDGLVIVGSNIQEKNFLLTLLGQKIPFTLIERNLSDSRMNCIWIDNTRGAYLAVKYLVEKGHRNIAHITGNTNFQVTRDRIEGYRTALQEAGIGFSDEWMVPGNFISRGGHEAMKGLLEHRPHFTAVFSSSDAMAYGALQAISEAGLKAPEDIALIGFDDLEFSGFTNPPLTTVRQPRYEMGQKSMELLVGILRGKGENGQKIRLDPELVIRKSV